MTNVELVVHLGGYGTRDPEVQIPIEIRDSSMKVVGRIFTGQTIGLPEGLYEIYPVLPDIQHRSYLINLFLDGNTRREIEISPTNQIYKSSDSSLLFANLTAQEPKFIRQASKLGFVLFREGRLQNWQTNPIELHQKKREDWIDLELQIIQTDPTYKHPNKPQSQIVLGVLQGLEREQFISLPLSPTRQKASYCRIAVVEREGSNKIVCGMRSPQGNLLANYSQWGYSEPIVATVTREYAEQLLLNKLEDPVAAAAGGYSLLRVGAIDRLHDWPLNLSNWFEWLPDGPIIAAEMLIRTGKLKEAIPFIDLSFERGFPIFTDGISILCSRLRQFSNEGLIKDHQKLVDIQNLARLVDWTSSLLTFSFVYGSDDWQKFHSGDLFHTIGTRNRKAMAIAGIS